MVLLAILGLALAGSEPVLAGSGVRSYAGSSYAGSGGLRLTAALDAGQRQAGPAKVRSVAATSWPAYLYGPSHTSYSASQRAISAANAARLRRQWLFTRGAPYVASPVVARGSVFIGSATGWLYKLSETTGAVQGRAFVGRERSLTCTANGVTSTATVARNRYGVLTVYVGGGNGYLYALRASDLRREWRALVGRPSGKVNSYYNWSSPTVAHGRVYLGIASTCDRPLVRGGVVAFRQSDGRRVAEYFTVPAGARNAGGSVWSSIGIGPDGDVYATTGNGPRARPRIGRSESILRLSPGSLRLLGAFKVPARQITTNGDFGGSPVFFDGMVGACNKNGIFYALNQTTMKLVWWKRVATAAGSISACLAAPAYNGTYLFLGTAATTVGGRAYHGSVQARLARTGALRWSTGLGGAVLGSPALDGGGLLTVPSFASTSEGGVYVVDASSGRTIRQLAQGQAFSQAVFANARLFCATARGVSAWRLR